MNKKFTSSLVSLCVLFSSSFGSVWAGGFSPVEARADVAPVHLSDLALSPEGANALSLPSEAMEESLQFEDSLGAIQKQIPLAEKKNPAVISQSVLGSQNAGLSAGAYNNKETGQAFGPLGASGVGQSVQRKSAEPLKNLSAFIRLNLKKLGARLFDGSKARSPLSALQFSAFAPSIRPLPKLKLPRGVKTDAGPIIPNFKEQPEFQWSLNAVSAAEDSTTPAAPNSQVFDRVVDISLSADPQNASDIERAVREMIDAHPQYKIKSADLGMSKMFLTQVPGQLPTWYASFHQQYTDGVAAPIPVYGSAINFTIQVKNDKPVIVGVNGRLFPNLKVDASSKFNDAVLEGKIRSRLKIKNEAATKIAFRDRQIFYVPSSSGKGGAWHAISLYKVDGIDALVAADIATGQTFLWDMRMGVAAPTTGPPSSASSASAQFEARVPKSDADMGTPPHLYQLPLPGVTVTLPDGREVQADDQGRVNIDLSNDKPLDVTARLESDHVVINNEAGDALVVKAQVVKGKDGAVVVFNPPTSVTGPDTPASPPTFWGKIVEAFKHIFSPSYRAKENAANQARAESEKELAQVSAYYSHYVFINWVMAHGVGEKDGLLKQKLTINVNIADECNAYYDPSSNTLNFFLSSAQCINTGTLPGVSFHESGHWTHALVASYAHLGLQAMASVDPGLGEGIGDMFATHILETPLIGEHFFNDPAQSPLPNVPGGALRETTNDYQFNPGDEVHRQGLAFMGTVGYGGAWHSLLIDALGKDKALSLIQSLIFPHIYGYANASDVPAALGVIYLAAKSLTDAAVKSVATKTLQQAAAKHGMTIPESQSKAPAA